MSQAEPPVQPPRACPDCGAPNPPDAQICVECNHPLEVPDTAPAQGPTRAPATPPPTPPTPAKPAEPVQRLDRPGRPERVSPNVTSWGYNPGRSPQGGSSIPSWLWIGVGLAALVAVLVTAVKIANQPPPLQIPNASKEQIASAESLRVLIKRDSTATAPNTAMGNLYYDTGNFADAIPFYRRALQHDPTLTDVRVDLGVAYHNSGNMEAARQELEEAVLREPNHPIANFDLGVVYQSLGRKEDARARYLKAKSVDHPPEMDSVIDQLIARLDKPAMGGSGLPPGHPDIGASSDSLPPGHPPIGGAP